MQYDVYYKTPHSQVLSETSSLFSILYSRYILISITGKLRIRYNPGQWSKSKQFIAIHSWMLVVQMIMSID